MTETRSITILWGKCLPSCRVRVEMAMAQRQGFTCRWRVAAKHVWPPAAPAATADDSNHLPPDLLHISLRSRSQVKSEWTKGCWSIVQHLCKDTCVCRHKHLGSTQSAEGVKILHTKTNSSIKMAQRRRHTEEEKVLFSYTITVKKIQSTRPSHSLFIAARLFFLPFFSLFFLNSHL